MKKFAVILAGCGVYDGAEIHEAVMTLYAIEKNGAAYEVFAPDIKQYHVKNHLTGQDMPEERNVLIESARIARGNIKSLTELDIRSFDAVIFPGGFGVAKNFCTFAFEGENCSVNPQIAGLIREVVSLRKPLGALCISPVLLVKLLGDVKVTIGQDAGTIQAIRNMGGQHVETTHGEVVIDEKHRIFTTPCYMLDASVTQIADGAINIVKKMLESM
ncbi:MAG: isoprenoid biosynthesis glyoxalase ElbB [Bacteroidetes bacterium]|nr:isoprenoid biosynthesis glyoxalase ElbB [Bacteroidota bacterium]